MDSSIIYIFTMSCECVNGNILYRLSFVVEFVSSDVFSSTYWTRNICTLCRLRTIMCCVKYWLLQMRLNMTEWNDMLTSHISCLSLSLYMQSQNIYIIIIWILLLYLIDGRRGLHFAHLPSVIFSIIIYILICWHNRQNYFMLMLCLVTINYNVDIGSSISYLTIQSYNFQRKLLVA